MARSRRFLVESLFLKFSVIFAILCTFNNPALAGNGYGKQGSISGDTYLVGQRFGNPAPGVGSVHVFDRLSSETWPETTTLESVLEKGSLLPNAEFGGGAVLIDSDTAVVGAYRNTVGDKYQAGNVFVFSYVDSVWINQTVLQMPGGAVENALFGAAGDIDTNRLLLSSAGLGKAFIYTRSGETWDSGVELLGGNIADPIGVAIDGNLAAVGNYGVDPHVDLWRYSQQSGTWDFETSILNPGGSENLLATSLDIDGNTLVVSARQETVGGMSGAGAVYVYEYSSGTWSLEQTIENPQPAGNDLFGYDVAIEGNRLAIGAPRDDTNGNDSGMAYLFTRFGSTWTLSESYSSASPQEKMWFGEVVDISEDVLLVSGASRADDIQATGEARWFDLPELPTPPDFPGDANRDGKVNADDAKALAEHWLMATGAAWADGDFNYDGKVNDVDAAIMAANWLHTQTTVAASAPEPGITVMLTALAGVGLLALLKGRTAA